MSNYLLKVCGEFLCNDQILSMYVHTIIFISVRSQNYFGNITWNYDIQQLVSRLQVPIRLLEKVICNQVFAKNLKFNC